MPRRMASLDSALWGVPRAYLCLEVRRPQDPEVRDETGDVPRGGHLDLEVPRAAPLRRHRNARHREHLLLRPLLDRDRPAPARAEVHRRHRGRDVERDAVGLREDRLRVRADLVRGVPVRRDAIRADEDEVHLASLEEQPRRGSRAARRGAITVPTSTVARAPALQCVSTRVPSLISRFPWRPIARHRSTSSRAYASAASRAVAPPATSRSTRSIAAKRSWPVGRVLRR